MTRRQTPEFASPALPIIFRYLKYVPLLLEVPPLSIMQGCPCPRIVKIASTQPMAAEFNSSFVPRYLCTALALPAKLPDQLDRTLNSHWHVFSTPPERIHFLPSDPGLRFDVPSIRVLAIVLDRSNNKSRRCISPYAKKLPSPHRHQSVPDNLSGALTNLSHPASAASRLTGQTV